MGKPKKFTTGKQLTAQEVNAYLVGESGAWRTYTPAITHGTHGAVSHTLNRAAYAVFGRLMLLSLDFQFTETSGDDYASMFVTLPHEVSGRIRSQTQNITSSSYPSDEVEGQPLGLFTAGVGAGASSYTTNVYPDGRLQVLVKPSNTGYWKGTFVLELAAPEPDVTVATMDQWTTSVINDACLGEGGGWSTYTPTVTQSGTVTNLHTFAKYARFGRLIVVTVQTKATAAGTANNAITVSLPVTAATDAVDTISGGWMIYDDSATSYYPFGHGCRIKTSTTVSFVDGDGDAGLTASDSPVTLANNDFIWFSCMYEAAS